MSFDDGTVVGPVGPGSTASENGIAIFNYLPGDEFYPWPSSSGDAALSITITGHATTGSIRVLGLTPGTGYIDFYGGGLTMMDHLVPGRLTDYATTRSAIVVAAHINGGSGELWSGSSGGPTRDGRQLGVDLSAPGHGTIISYPRTHGLYGSFGATSGAAPIVVGAVALMLQANPTLTANDVRQILRDTATEDVHTGTVPNTDWGFGKLDVFEAVRMALPEPGPESEPTQPTIFIDGFESGESRRDQ